MRIAVLTLSLFSTMAASAQTPLDGKTLFTQRCSLCHQAEGGGTWMLASCTTWVNAASLGLVCANTRPQS